MEKLWTKRLKPQIAKPKHAVYSIKNTITGKIYYGYTEYFKRRMSEHRNMSKKKKIPKLNLLYRDMKDLGFDAFEFKLVKEFDTITEAVEYEKQMMNQCDPNLLYNKQKYNKGTWKSGKKPKDTFNEIQTLMAKIIETQIKINLKLIEQSQKT